MRIKCVRMVKPATAYPSTPVLWRAGWVLDPGSPPDPGVPPPHRFDSPTGAYRVLYMATTEQAAYGEAIASLRPKPALAAKANLDWSENGLRAGELARAWRLSHSLAEITVSPTTGQEYLDYHAQNTRRVMERDLADVLIACGVDHLDLPEALGRDRHLSQAVSQWAFDAGYLGVRYLSQYDTSWECWAMFFQEPADPLLYPAVKAHPIEATDPALCEVMALYGMRCN